MKTFCLRAVISLSMTGFAYQAQAQCETLRYEWTRPSFGPYQFAITSAGDFLWPGGVLSQNAPQPNDVFTVLRRPDGRTGWIDLWDYHAEGTGIAGTGRAALDAHGNFYLAGGFRGSVDFDPGPSVDERSGSQTNGLGNTFLTKLDPQGAYLWTRSFDSQRGQANPSGLAVDVAGNAVVVGWWCCSPYDFEPGEAEDYHASLGSTTDVFITKFFANGSYAWTRTIGGNGFDAGEKVIADAQGNIFASGTFRGLVDFDFGLDHDQHVVMGAGFFENVFVTKISPEGDYRWTRTSLASRAALATTPDGGLIVAGVSIVGFEPPKLAVTKLNGDGSHGWTYAPAVFGFEGVAVMPNGDILVGGNLQGTVDFDPGESVVDRTCGTPEEICEFLLLLHSDGRLASVRTTPHVNASIAARMILDAEGNVYYTRQTYDHNVDSTPVADFDPTCEVDWRERPEYGGLFVTKLSCSPPNPDFDADGDVDLFDLARFQECFTGQGVTRCGTGCAVFDLVPDNALDGSDLARFATLLSGPR